MKLQIRKKLFADMLAHAKSGLPNEACGLIAGLADGEVQRVEAFYPMTNPDASPEHFSIDPREHLIAVKAMRAAGLSPLGNFHSHPSSPARPSSEDIRLAHDRNASYLILSLANPERPELKAFHIEDGLGFEEELEWLDDSTDTAASA